MLGKIAALSVFNSVGFYLMFVYIVTWLELVDGIPPAHALGINTISMAALLPLQDALGALNDLVVAQAVTGHDPAFRALAEQMPAVAAHLQRFYGSSPIPAA